MLAGLKKVEDVSPYIRKLALYTQAVLTACRDFEQLKHKRSKGSEAQALLIPEVFEALRRFGRQLQKKGRGAAPKAMI